MEGEREGPRGREGTSLPSCKRERPQFQFKATGGNRLAFKVNQSFFSH